MTNQKYDVVVIGSGPGGYVAAIRCAQLGLKTACVEKEKTLGGTCLNVGCIPSKALLQSSEHYDWIRHESKTHGISCPEVSIDFPQMMIRKEQVVKSLVQGVATLFKKHKIENIQGTARFISANQIEVSSSNGSQTIEASSFILATGSEPIPLPFLPFDEKVIVSSTGALRLEKIPKKLTVVGAGVIGVELASVYNRLGTEVTIVEMLDHICPAMDETICKSLLQILKKQGLTFYLGAKVIDGKSKKGGVELSVEHGGEKLSLTSDVVMVAIGRRPYSTGLGLQEIGIKLERGMVGVDANFKSSIPHIYAIGDLIDGPMLAHKASEEGYAVAEIIAGHSPHVNYLSIPNVIYTHPEVAAVGMTEKEAIDAGLDIVIGTVAFRGNPRARCSGYMEGFVKVIGAGKERHLVGMHLIGPQVSELINIGAVAIERRATLLDIATLPIAHPTLSEAIKEACGSAIGSAIHV